MTQLTHLEQLLKEHSDAIQMYAEADRAVLASMGRVAAEIAKNKPDPRSAADMYNKIVLAAKLMDQAMTAVIRTFTQK